MKEFSYYLGNRDALEFCQTQRYIHMYLLLQFNLGFETTALVLKSIDDEVSWCVPTLVKAFIKENDVTHYNEGADLNLLFSCEKLYKNFETQLSFDVFTGVVISYVYADDGVFSITLDDCGQLVNTLDCNHYNGDCYEAQYTYSIRTVEYPHQFATEATRNAGVGHRINEVEFYWKLKQMLQYFKSKMEIKNARI